MSDLPSPITNKLSETSIYSKESVVQTNAEELGLELHSQLMLQALPGVGPVLQQKLVQHLGSAQAVWCPGHRALVKTLLPKKAQLLWQKTSERQALADRVSAQLEWLQQHHIIVIYRGHPDYPPLLNATDGAPPLLYIKGNSECLHMPQVALVGSRNMTPGGKQNALAFAEYLAAAGFTITSGLALGVDGAAHQGALQAQGKTIAVMGTGIDRLYPRQHQNLAEQIVAGGGALVTELPLGAKPEASHFPRRNRIISGLSAGVLVVEAALKSGSLITAKQALDQGRSVFAIPGSIHNPMSRGCHQLIKQGAVLVETAADIVAELHSLLSSMAVQQHTEAKNSATCDDHNGQSTGFSALTSPQQTILSAVGYDPVYLDELVDNTGLPVGELSSELLSLELDGWVQQVGGQYMRCRR